MDNNDKLDLILSKLEQNSQKLEQHNQKFDLILKN